MNPPTSPTEATDRGAGAPTGQDLRFAAFVTLTIAVAAGALIGSIRWLDPSTLVGPTPTLFWIMAAGLFAAEVRPPSWITFGNEPVSVSWIFALSLVLMGAPAGSLLVIAVASAANALVTRSRLDKSVFNIAQVVVSLAAGVGVLEVTGQARALEPGRSPGGVGWIVAVALAAGAIYGANAVLVAGAMNLSHGRPFVATVVDGLRVNIAGDGVLLALAPVAVVVGQRALVLLPFAALTAIGVFGLARSALNHERAATHDHLTSLANRRGFEERSAALADARGERLLAVVLIDLDRFKPINDRHGHAAGDRVLARVAERIAGAAPVGAVAARLGGDEFAVAWLCESAESAERVGAALLRAIQVTVEVAPGTTVEVEGSVGVSVGADEVAIGLGRADTAMYRAKVEGLGLVVLDTAGPVTR